MVLFGVTVLIVTTCAVKTKGQTYFEDWKLPAKSIYKQVEDKIAARARVHDGIERMVTMAYGNKVVNKIESGASGRVWLVPSLDRSSFKLRGMDSEVARGTGLDNLSQST